MIRPIVNRGDVHHAVANSPPIMHAVVFSSNSIQESTINQLKKMLEEQNINLISVPLGHPPPSMDIHLPCVYVSFGADWKEIETKAGLTPNQEARWIHFENIKDFTAAHLFQAWLAATESLVTFPGSVTPKPFTSNYPLVSIFTTTYRSRDRILRPYRSLLSQTYENWEWIIVDDSGDDDETYIKHIVPLSDSRVRKYRQEKRCGYIGSVKRFAASLCLGEIIMEVDHDDDLTPKCLEWFVKGFKENPECGFAFGEACEVTEKTHQSRWYGWDFAFGYGLYWRQWVSSLNAWQNVPRTADLNRKTIQHLAGLPNHPRVWTKWCYQAAGGHRPGLSVADDYDLLIRSFLITRFLRIPHLCYLQYINDGRDNHTVHRNKSIQLLVDYLFTYYCDRIQTKWKELGAAPIEQTPYGTFWNMPPSDLRKQAFQIDGTSSTLNSLAIIITEDENSPPLNIIHLLLSHMKVHSPETHEIIVVGKIPPEIETEFATQYPDAMLRWWTMRPTDTYLDCVRYANAMKNSKNPLQLVKKLTTGEGVTLEPWVDS